MRKLKTWRPAVEQRRDGGSTQQPHPSPADRGPRVHRRDQDQFLYALRSQRRRHHGHRAAVRRAKQITIADFQYVQKAQQALRDFPQPKIEVLPAFGETCSRQIWRNHMEFRCQRRKRESPGKGITQQPMNQDQRKARPGLQIASANSIYRNPLLVLIASRRGGGHGVSFREGQLF